VIAHWSEQSDPGEGARSSQRVTESVSAVNVADRDRPGMCGRACAECDATTILHAESGGVGETFVQSSAATSPQLPSHIISSDGSMVVFRRRMQPRAPGHFTYLSQISVRLLLHRRGWGRDAPCARTTGAAPGPGDHMSGTPVALAAIGRENQRARAGDVEPAGTEAYSCYLRSTCGRGARFPRTRIRVRLSCGWSRRRRTTYCTCSISRPCRRPAQS
jgi:hypothetical protein